MQGDKLFQTINIVVGTAWVVAGLVSLGLSFPLIAGQVGPNPLYGARFREAFQSDEAWYAINRFGGQRFALWSLAQTACGIAAYFAPLKNNDALTIMVGVAPIAFVLIPMFQTWRFAKRLVIPAPNPPKQ